MIQKILYVDTDNVLVDFQTGIDRLSQETCLEYEGRLDEAPRHLRSDESHARADRSL
jgi:hypothetical protein